MPLDGNIRAAGAEMRWFDADDAGIGIESRHGDIEPACAAVAGELDVSVVRSDPQQAARER